MRVSSVIFLVGLVGLVAYGSLQATSASASASRSFWPNGQPRAEIVLHEGEKNGPARAWYPDGVLRFEGAYANGVRQGDWRFFGPDGDLDESRSGRYEDGRFLGDPSD